MVISTGRNGTALGTGCSTSRFAQLTVHFCIRTHVDCVFGSMSFFSDFYDGGVTLGKTEEGTHLSRRIIHSRKDSYHQNSDVKEL